MRACRRVALVPLLFLLACDGAAEVRRISARSPGGYAAIVARAEARRVSLAADWRAAGSDAAGEAVLGRAAAELAGLLAEQILPAWNGTAWAFSGTAVRPGPEPVACGYFVSTALTGAGLRVERSRLAQQTGEDIVRSLVPEAQIRRFRRVPLGSFLARIRTDGDGVYVVGLDRHVGFLLVSGRRMYFHHASRSAGRVVREPAILSSALATSSYRVAGKLADRGLLVSWLTGSPIATQTRSAAR